MKKNKVSLRRHGKYTLLGVMLVGMVCAATLLYTTDVSDFPKIRRWHVAAVDVDPGAGLDGVVNVHIYPHSANSTYDSYISESGSFEHFDDSWNDGEDLDGTTPYGTLFDIVCVYQVDKDHVHDGSWNTSNINAFLNWSSYENSTQVQYKSAAFFNTTADDGLINLVWCNVGAGYTITADEFFTQCQIKVYLNY